MLPCRIVFWVLAVTVLPGHKVWLPGCPSPPRPSRGVASGPSGGWRLLACLQLISAREQGLCPPAAWTMHGVLELVQPVTSLTRLPCLNPTLTSAKFCPMDPAHWMSGGRWTAGQDEGAHLWTMRCTPDHEGVLGSARRCGRRTKYRVLCPKKQWISCPRHVHPFHPLPSPSIYHESHRAGGHLRLPSALGAISSSIYTTLRIYRAHLLERT